MKSILAMAMVTLWLLAATPAIITAESPKTPPSDRGSHPPGSSNNANAAADEMILAPDPVLVNGLQKISGPHTFQENDQILTAFLYSITLSAPSVSPASAPDCHAQLALLICGHRYVRAVGWPATLTGDDLTLTEIPIGTQTFSLVFRGEFTGSPTPWTLTVDDGRKFSGTTTGPQCGPNAVALAGFGAGQGADATGVLLALLLGLAALLGGMLVVVRRRLPPA